MGTGFPGTFPDQLEWGVAALQQQPEVPSMEQTGPFPSVPFCAVGEIRTTNRQHQPWGNAKVRLQASTSDRRMRLFIIVHHRT